MEAGGWLDYQHRPIQNWQSALNRVRTKWEADGRPQSPPKNQNATNRPNAPDRNNGTYNTAPLSDALKSKVR
jgi:hypothetical protein